MSNTFKTILLLILILTLLAGITAYLGYMYFNKLKKPDGAVTEGRTFSKSTLLGGKVLRGSYFDFLPAECSGHYFLSSGDKRIWLTLKDGSSTQWPLEFSKYEFYEVTISGKIGIRAWPCSDDFIVVEKIETKTKEEAKIDN